MKRLPSHYAKALFTTVHQHAYINIAQCLIYTSNMNIKYNVMETRKRVVIKIYKKYIETYLYE